MEVTSNHDMAWVRLSHVKVGICWVVEQSNEQLVHVLDLCRARDSGTTTVSKRGLTRAVKCLLH